MKHAVQLGRGFRNLAALGAVATLLFGLAASGDAKTWTVTTTDDSATNTGSIRYIVSKAGKGDTIKFSSDGATLTNCLTLDKKLTIEGPATIRQSGGQRIFYIPEGGNVTLKKLTLTGGGRAMDLGGAICNLGSLKMEDCTVSGNSSVFEGGGIASSGSLTMENCVIENNSAYFFCGGVINRGKLEIDGGKIRNNSCGSGGSSALYNAGGASAEIKNCEIANNTGSGGAGGIKNEGTLEMTGCTVASHSGATSGGIENTGSLSLKKCAITGNASRCNGGGIYNYAGALTAERCTITGNSARYAGGGIYHLDALSDPNAAGKCRLKDKTIVAGNAPDQISGPYKADDNCTIGSAPNRSARSFSGYSGETEPEPRSIVGDADVTEVKDALADPASDVFAAVSNTLSNDLGGASGDMTASLFYANMFEGVAIESRDLVVEYTASYPERARYYALFARADGSGYELPDRGVQFELHAGQSLPDGVTPPDFYEKGEGLMTWRSVVTDNGSYDLEPAVGVVTFRVCSVRAAEQAVGDKGSGGGCDAGASAGSLPLALLLALPLLTFARSGRNARKE
jgi:predicted outer membrane repeat protein